MATTPTPPPAAAAPSAPASTSTSTAPSSAPSSTPVSTPVAAPVAAPVEAPAAATPEAPAAGAAPATAAKPQPTQADFPGDPQAFLEALHAWEREEGNEVTIPGADTEAPEVATPKPEEKTEEAKTETETEKAETEEEDKPWAPEKADVTPEAVNGWAEKNPLLKQVWEQNPEIKNQMFAMARDLAKKAPIAQFFPNVEAAEFAAQSSSRLVDLRSAFQGAVDAEEPMVAIGKAYESLAEEFMIVDDKGKPVLDAGGNPQFGEDFQPDESNGCEFLHRFAD